MERQTGRLIWRSLKHGLEQQRYVGVEKGDFELLLMVVSPRRPVVLWAGVSASSCRNMSAQLGIGNADRRWVLRPLDVWLVCYCTVYGSRIWDEPDRLKHDACLGTSSTSYKDTATGGTCTAEVGAVDGTKL